MVVKCTKCKREYDVCHYIKKGKQLKTCTICREKGKAYRNKVKVLRTKVYINEPMPEPVPVIPYYDDPETMEEEYALRYQEREDTNNEILDKMPKNKLYDNVRLLYKLIKKKYHDKQNILVALNDMNNKVHLSLWYVTGKDKENINDCSMITVNESTTWKMVDKRIKKLLEGVPRECYICTETHDYSMCCETCPFSYCTDCYIEIKKTTGKHTCPSCRGTTFNLGSYDIYYSSLDCLD
jgi:hypothetical protein